MQTPFRDGFLDIRLGKAETTQVQKALATCQTLALMKPLRKGINEAATAAAESLTALLALVGCDVPKSLPLLDQAETAVDTQAATE